MRRLIDSLRARFKGLRCRPGDLAIVVRACDHSQFPGVVLLKPGTVVRVVRISKSGLWELESVIPFRAGFGATVLTGDIVAIADDLLRPLRDKPGEDETLTALRAPRPQVKPAVSRPAVTQMRQAVESGAVGYSHPTPIEPKDEVAELQKQFIQATEAMQALSARLELLTTGVRHLRSAA